MIFGTHFHTITQLRISLAICHLNSFLAIIRLIDEERLGVWMLTSNNISHTIFFDCICDEVKTCTA